MTLAKHYTLVSGARRIDAMEAQSATVSSLDAAHAIRIVRSEQPAGTLIDKTAGAIDAVQIVRFDYQPPPRQLQHHHHLIAGRINGLSGGLQGSSPILLLKNFNGDRGLSLFNQIYGAAAGRASGSARGALQQYHPSAAHGQLHPQSHAVIHKAADRVLDICEYAVLQREHRGAYRALQSRTPYNMTLARPYAVDVPAQSALPHHVDAIGGWVVLFSFGLTVDFFVGHKTVCIESGDALVFNGGPAHGVVHGFSQPVRSHATLRGQTQALVGMRSIDGFRLSVQARQQ
jgi:hypothetical protein